MFLGVLPIDRHTVNCKTQHTTTATGFTLLELLVVLVIIGIVSSFAVLSTGLTGRNKPLDKESQRLLALMQMASEESVQKTEELGLTISNDSYRFLRYDYDQNTWQPIEGFISKRTEATFSHSYCPDCIEKYVKPDIEAYRIKKLSGT